MEVDHKAQLLVKVAQVAPHSDLERWAYFTHSECCHDDFVLNNQ
jgi:hypothetical protein